MTWTRVAEQHSSEIGRPMSSLSDSRETAVLLIAHGSRRADANRDLVELARRLRDQSGYQIVEIGYLELAEPTIQQGGAACVKQGARRVMLLPYFLSAGTHVTADLERFRAELATAHPQMEFRLCPPLGLHPLMTEIVQDRLAEGLDRA
jgi:sirohydrochlorin ferrochelatase